VDSSPFTSLFGEDRFVHRIEGVTIMGLNSNLIKYNDPSEVEQIQWIGDELSKTDPEDVKIVFAHHPFFIENIDEEDSYFPIQQSKRRAYFDLFAEHGVDAVFAGHLHASAAGEYKGIPMLTTTSSGYQLGDERPSVRLITVTGNKVSEELLPL
jgi:3',5'-cyclic AMP phosphodiesterase CpdA